MLPPPRPAAGRGRETNRLPAALKRQGSLVPLVMPTRGPVITPASRQLPAASIIRKGGAVSGAAFCSGPMPRASVSFPGPEQSS